GRGVRAGTWCPPEAGTSGVPRVLALGDLAAGASTVACPSGMLSVHRGCLTLALARFTPFACPGTRRLVAPADHATLSIRLHWPFYRHSTLNGMGQSIDESNWLLTPSDRHRLGVEALLASRVRVQLDLAQDFDGAPTRR